MCGIIDQETCEQALSNLIREGYIIEHENIDNDDYLE